MSIAQRKRQEVMRKQRVEQPRSQRTQEDVLALTDVTSDAKVRRFLVRSLMLSFAQVVSASFNGILMRALSSCADM